MSDEAMSPTDARARLAAAKMYMRYDYAWKEAEFSRAESRQIGVVCRLLYLYELWRGATASATAGEPIEGSVGSDARPKVLVDANGYPVFEEDIAKACKLMGFELITPQSDERVQAQFAFVYVSPHGEERVDNQYATFEALTAYHKEQNTPVNQRPIFCFLLGEAAFLDPPANAETERLRGLSGFAISQRFTPILETASYSSIAHFAVEYTPQILPVNRGDMSDLMNQFGCMDHNVMHHTEKWECYGPNESVLINDPELAHAGEEEIRFWLELTHGKTCSQCHEWREKLSKCSRCGNAFYCSRECQKVAWRLHKQLCGKSAEEINAQATT